MCHIQGGIKRSPRQWFSVEHAMKALAGLFTWIYVVLPMSVKSPIRSIYSSFELKERIFLRRICLLTWLYTCHTNLVNTEPCRWCFFEHFWQEEQHASKLLHYYNTNQRIRDLVLWHVIYHKYIMFAALSAGRFIVITSLSELLSHVLKPSLWF